MNDEQKYFRLSEQTRSNFNSAANSYDKAAVLQRVVSERLLDKLDDIKIKPSGILDLGSGTGTAAKFLAKKYSGTRIFETDFALNMLRLSAASSPRFFSRQRHVCAAAEQLPIVANVMDMVYSNLMLQWCNYPDLVYAEVNRVLRPGGLFIFSTFGPDTLKELRQSWRSVDDRIHVNAFFDMHDVGDAVIRAGFENPVMETEKFTLTYDDVLTLLQDLKQIGAQNVNKGRRHTLTAKERLKRMIAEYEKLRRDGKLPASYEVIYGHAWRRSSGPRKKSMKAQASFVVPVSSISKRTP